MRTVWGHMLWWLCIIILNGSAWRLMWPLFFVAVGHLCTGPTWSDPGAHFTHEFSIEIQIRYPTAKLSCQGIHFIDTIPIHLGMKFPSDLNYHVNIVPKMVPWAISIKLINNKAPSNANHVQFTPSISLWCHWLGFHLLIIIINYLTIVVLEQSGGTMSIPWLQGPVSI